MNVQTELRHAFFFLFFFAWPAPKSSQLSLLLLANTLDSAAELRLCNPDCQTLRKDRLFLNFRCYRVSETFLDAYFCLLIKRSVELHQTSVQGFRPWGFRLCRWAPAGLFSSSSSAIIPASRSSLPHGLLWVLLLATSFTASCQPPPHSHAVKPIPAKSTLLSPPDAAASVASSL